MPYVRRVQVKPKEAKQIEQQIRKIIANHGLPAYRRVSNMILAEAAERAKLEKNIKESESRLAELKQRLGKN